MSKTFRLYIKEELSPDKIIELTIEQTHYLKNVVKYSPQDTLNCFDNKNGEFTCQIAEDNKKNLKITFMI